MSADRGSGETPAEASMRERLRAVPVVDLRPVITPPERPPVTPKEVETQTAAPSEAVPASVEKREGGGWLVPFLAGVLIGAGGFYAVLWLRALI